MDEWGALVKKQSLEHVSSITLVFKAESIDSLITKEKRVPTIVESLQYANIIAELQRRNQYKVCEYYKNRFSSVYAHQLKQRGGE